MAINFPDSPNVNDTYTVDDKTFIWTGEYWRVLNSPNYISSLIKDADNDTKVTVENSVDEDVIRMYTGGSERVSVGASAMIPATNETYDLGSPTNRFKDLYLSGSSIDLGGVTLSTDGTKLAIESSEGGGALDFATESYVNSAVSGLVDTAPETLNTLNELAAALGDDPNFATTVTNSISVLSPTGSVTMFAGSSAPSGWLLCEGQPVSRTTYASLFAVVGTTYGAGDGSTTFNVPNMKGRVPVGRDSGDGSFNALGETGGAKTHTLTADESGVPSHGHGFSGTFASSSHTHQHISPVGLVAGTLTIHRPDDSSMDLLGSYDFNSIQTVARADIGTASAGTEVWRVTSTGPSANSTGTVNNNTAANAISAHNNLQPYITLNYIIKV